MKTAVEKLNPTLAKIQVEVPFEEFKPHLDSVYKELAHQIQLPGFRKGKVPAALIDQRVGYDFVVENALNEALNGFYQQALTENELTPLTQPEVEVLSKPESDDRQKDVSVALVVTIRPEVELPDYSGIKVEVAKAEASAEDEQKALDDLRSRFGTLQAADRPAAEDDFVTLDLTASIDGEEVDSANELSYQVGANTMIDGLDEAITGLSAGEDAIFESTLKGGEHDGEEATVKVTVTAVKERVLPEADDEFAQLASEFDTLEELKQDLSRQAAEGKVAEQGAEARDKVLDRLVDMVEIPVPEKVIEEQLEQHFTNAGEDHDTEEHRAEVRENTERAFRNEVILDAIAEKEQIGVEQSELIEYIITMSSQYGMDPNQFAQMLDSSGQSGMIIGEVRRSKALGEVLKQAEVVDSEGNAVDLSAFLGTGSEDQAEEQSEDSEQA